MRTTLALLALTLGLTACGQGSGGSAENLEAAKICSTEMIGTWKTTGNTDNLIINSDCSARTVICQNQMTYTQPDQNGYFTLVVGFNNATYGCISLGTHRCSMAFDRGVRPRPDLIFVCQDVPAITYHRVY